MLSEKRLFDLVRYCRQQLLDEGLISVEEFVALLDDGDSVGRLESYDALRERLLTHQEETAKRLDHAAWKGFNQSDSEFEKGYKHAMGVAAQVVRASTTKAERS